MYDTAQNLKRRFIFAIKKRKRSEGGTKKSESKSSWPFVSVFPLSSAVRLDGGISDAYALYSTGCEGREEREKDERRGGSRFRFLPEVPPPREMEGTGPHGIQHLREWGGEKGDESQVRRTSARIHDPDTRRSLMEFKKRKIASKGGRRGGKKKEKERRKRDHGSRELMDCPEPVGGRVLDPRPRGSRGKAGRRSDFSPPGQVGTEIEKGCRGERKLVD